MTLETYLEKGKGKLDALLAERGPGALSVIEVGARASSMRVRSRCMKAAARVDDPRAWSLVVRGLDDPKVDVEVAALHALEALLAKTPESESARCDRIRESMLTLSTVRNGYFRAAAIEALARAWPRPLAELSEAAPLLDDDSRAMWRNVCAERGDPGAIESYSQEFIQASGIYLIQMCDRAVACGGRWLLPAVEARLSDETALTMLPEDGKRQCPRVCDYLADAVLALTGAKLSRPERRGSRYDEAQMEEIGGICRLATGRVGTRGATPQ